ncbi:MAG: DUF92 domain-containing protein [Bacteroidetes bacterium]|nr:MAG: DUF92 domain-containing protein [Bacteroidota bacterium]
MPQIPAAYFLPAALFAGVFVWYTYRKRALTLDGGFVAAAVGLWVLSFAGPLWLLPLFFFFISSTALGRLNKERLTAADVRHGQPRDFRQVLCNGGIYAILATGVVWVNSDIIFLLMSVSLAVSTADTWSSEIGQYFRQPTYDMLRWKNVPVGLSGGVSLAGTIGGLVGAFSIALLCSLLLQQDIRTPELSGIAVAGFCGMVLDSLLGAAMQARYLDPDSGMLSDRNGLHMQRYSGFEWMSNDGVNFWSNLLVTAVSVWLV